MTGTIVAVTIATTTVVVTTGMIVVTTGTIVETTEMTTVVVTMIVVTTVANRDRQPYTSMCPRLDLAVLFLRGGDSIPTMCFVRSAQ